MGKHNNKKKSTTDSQLLYLGIGIFVVFMLIVVMQYINNQVKKLEQEAQIWDLSDGLIFPGPVTGKLFMRN